LGQPLGLFDCYSYIVFTIISCIVAVFYCVIGSMIGAQPVCGLATVCLVLCIEDISVWGE